MRKLSSLFTGTLNCSICSMFFSCSISVLLLWCIFNSVWKDVVLVFRNVFKLAILHSFTLDLNSNTLYYKSFLGIMLLFYIFSITFVFFFFILFNFDRKYWVNLLTSSENKLFELLFMLFLISKRVSASLLFSRW